MTIEHNVVVVGGLEYKAVAQINIGCYGCDLKGVAKCHAVNCAKHERADCSEVIFKRHYRPTHKELQSWKY